MPQGTNRTYRPSRSLSPSDDENTPPLGLDTSKEALIKVSNFALIENQSCDRVSEIARQHQAQKNTLSQENEALRRKLGDISNDNDDTNNDHGEGSVHRSKRQRTRNPTPAGSDNETVADTNASQADLEDEFVNNIGHKFSIIYSLWVHNGADIFKTHLDDAYDTATERFENDDNKIQGQLQEIIGLLEERLHKDTILHQKWVPREV